MSGDETQTSPAAKVTFYEPSAISTGLFTILFVGAFVFLVGVYIKQSPDSAGWPWFGGTALVLSAVYWLHGRRFEFDPAKQTIRVTAMVFLLFAARSATYRFSDVEEIRRVLDIDAPDDEYCILKLKGGGTYKLYNSRGYKMIGPLFPTMLQKAERVHFQ